jgi:hypothetical protein
VKLFGIPAVIVLNLCCEHEHLFEGWFASADAYEGQRERGEVTCPVCGSAEIARRPTAPYVNTGSSVAVLPPQSAQRAPEGSTISPDAVATMLAMLRRFGRESEDVGERFAEEARGIHYGDREARNIKGQASREDVGELIEEGILVLPLPADEDFH